MGALIGWLNQNSGAVTAIAAVAGVLVTAVYSFFTILLWHATKRQAELTREIFEATHRPHVSIRPHIRTPANPGYVRLDFELRNHGSSPALVTEWFARFVVAKTEAGKSKTLQGALCVFPGSNQEGQ